MWNTVLVAAGSGHLGGTLSIMDIAAALYLKHIRHDPRRPDWEDRDRVFWSVGHKAPALYAALAMAGYFDDRAVSFHGEPLQGFEGVSGLEQTVLLRRLGSGFEGHPNRLKLQGLEASSGLLGRAWALRVLRAARDDGRQDHTCYRIMGDGERYGSV